MVTNNQTKINHVCIVIVTYNAKRWIERCLEGALISVKDNMIFVVDNHSTDDTVEWIKSNYPKINLISLPKNIGFGQANNIGMAKALELGAEAVFLMNQDVYLLPNTLAALWHQSQQHPEYGILSPMHYNGTGTALDANFSSYIVPNKCPDLYSDAIIGTYQKQVYALPFVNAAAWLVTKACLETVGGFNPSFFHYGEDNNYCHRVLYHSFKIGIIPNIYIVHDRFNENIQKYKTLQKIKLRSFIIKTSRPDNNNNLLIVYLSRIFLLFKYLLCFKFKDLYESYVFYFIDPKFLLKVLQNRNITKNKGAAFLNYNYYSGIVK